MINKNVNNKKFPGTIKQIKFPHESNISIEIKAQGMINIKKAVYPSGIMVNKVIKVRIDGEIQHIFGYSPQR